MLICTRPTLYLRGIVMAEVFLMERAGNPPDDATRPIPTGGIGLKS
jgi:hypothetical protein